MEEKSTFSLAMKPGLILSAVYIAFSLVIWALVADMDTQKYIGWLGIVIIAFLFHYFTVEYRNTIKGGALTYGEGFKFMFFMGLVYSVVYAAYYFIFLSYIDTELLTRMLDVVEQQYYDQGLAEDTVEKAMSFVSMIFTPGLFSLASIFGSLFSSVLIGLVVSFFTKKEAPLDFENN
jgi:hypothetical protein